MATSSAATHSSKLVQGGSAVSSLPLAAYSLVSNSLDAEADIINVVLSNDYTLKVEDNGIGLSGEDFKLLGVLGATSKPETRRGASLNSISYVSDVDVCSRHRSYDPNQGHSCFYKRIVQGSETALQNALKERPRFGTTVTLSNFFSNMPVRRRLLNLKDCIQEIRILLQKLVLGSPSVEVILYQGNTEAFRYTKTESTRAAFCQLFGNVNLVDCCVSGDGFEISALVSPPVVEELRTKDLLQFTYLNADPIAKVPKLFDFINKMYRRFVPDTLRRMYCPNFVVAISCPKTYYYHTLVSAEAVHFVEFKNWNVLFKLVKQMLDKVFGLDNCDGSFLAAEHRYSIAKRSLRSDFGFAYSSVSSSSTSRPNKNSKKRRVDEGTVLRKEELTEFKIIGQAGRKFILIQSGGRILCVDQHAAHERVRLELFEQEIQEIVQCKKLVSPEQVRVSKTKWHVLESRREQFKQWGYRFSSTQNDETILVSLTHGPSLFGDRHLGLESFLEILDEMQVNFVLQEGIPKPIREAVISRACHGAIKFGDELSYKQCETLLHDLSRCKFPFQCAHGRPSVCPLLRI